MGRYYHLSKKITDDQKYAIIREMEELDDVQTVEITDDNRFMKVVTKDNEFGFVMYQAVNICNRILNGLEIQFDRFAYED